MANSLLSPTKLIPNAIRLPKAPAPRVTHLKTTFHRGKVTISHHFSNGGHKDFNFPNPEKATAHIRRALKTEWLHPQENLGTKINREIGEN